ncbi:MCP four helix bundle domain-containing protein [Fulvivirga maritima]|uniref:MCP four helix bundle domain-containing protein n=1 Tax=Fulvivirga maritima TaxID=2904247 RepID=UPI001F391BC5|nr:MCP four helix bundle domain-containing protein [Fulvivirga maritima]UII25410.1 MCP four helix bundle domain-containing protein [Fulvivirga maritima]
MKGSRFTTNQRIVGIFAFVLLISVSGAVFNSFQTQSLKAEIEKIYNDNLLSIDYLIEADRDAYQSSIAVAQALSKNIQDDNVKFNTALNEIAENVDQVEERYTQFYKISAFTKNDQYNQYDVYDENFRREHKSGTSCLIVWLACCKMGSLWKPMTYIMETIWPLLSQ